MSDLIKKIKIKKQDGTFTDYIPIGAEAQNVSTSDGDSVQLKLNKKPYYYNSVADMKADTKLKAGDMAVTLGYYEPNDGGCGTYIITDDKLENSHYENLNNGKYAKLVIKDNTIDIKQLGTKGDGKTDSTNIFKEIINLGYNIFLSGDYIISDILDFENVILVGNKCKIIITSQSTPREHIIHFSGVCLVENIEFVQKTDTSLIGLFGCKDTVFKNCKFIVDNVKTNGYVDVYTDNNNVKFVSCVFDNTSINSFGSIDIGGVWVRENNVDNVTENIFFDKCIFSQCSKDEIIAIWDWNGKVKNVYITNCSFDDKNGTGTMPHFISLSCENIIFSDCNISRMTNSTVSSIFRDDSEYQSIVSDSNIKISCPLSNGLIYGSIILQNSTIISSVSLNLASYLFSGQVNSIIRNCKIKCLYCNMRKLNMYNCIIEFDVNTEITNQIIRDNVEMIDCTIKNINITTGQFIQLFEATDFIHLINNYFDFKNKITYFLFAGANNINDLVVFNNKLSGSIYYTGDLVGYIANNITDKQLPETTENLKIVNNTILN